MSESGAKRTKVVSREEQDSLNKRLHDVIIFSSSSEAGDKIHELLELGAEPLFYALQLALESNRSGVIILDLLKHGGRLESMDNYPLEYFDKSRIRQENPESSDDKKYIPLELPQTLLRTIPIESLRSFNTLNILKFAIDKHSQFTNDYSVRSAFGVLRLL